MLHLRLRQVDGVWYAAEVSTTTSTGYGVHRFLTIGDLDRLDQHVVAGFFLYQDDDTEIDIEFTKWSDADARANAWFVVQPGSIPGNIEPWTLAQSGTYTTHSINWQPSSIHFTSSHGHYDGEPPAGQLAHQWRYTGSTIPAAEQNLRIHINLWLNQGVPPADGQDVEVTVRDVQFTPSRWSWYLPAAQR